MPPKKPAQQKTANPSAAVIVAAPPPPKVSSATNDIHYASFFSRCAAFIADTVLFSLLGGLTAGLGHILYIPYMIWMESSAKQATLGKMGMGIKVTDLKGNRITLGRSVIRSLVKSLFLYFFSASLFMIFLGTIFSGAYPSEYLAVYIRNILILLLPPIIPFLIGVFTKKRQTLHDFIAGTIVIQDLSKISASNTTTLRGRAAVIAAVIVFIALWAVALFLLFG